MTERRIIISVEDMNGEPQGVLSEGVGRGKSRAVDLLDAQMIARLRLQGREVRIIDPKMFVGQVATAQELGGQP